jgi:hypothetical protein
LSNLEKRLFKKLARILGKRAVGGNKTGIVVNASQKKERIIPEITCS